MAQSVEDEPALFMVSASDLPDVPNFDSKSTEVEVIDDGVTAPLVSVKPEKELLTLNPISITNPQRWR